MPRKQRVIRPIMKNISLPETLVSRVEMELYSEVEARVPFGAWAMLVGQLLTDWLAKVDAARAVHTGKE